MSHLSHLSKPNYSSISFKTIYMIMKRRGKTKKSKNGAVFAVNKYSANNVDNFYILTQFARFLTRITRFFTTLACLFTKKRFAPQETVSILYMKEKYNYRNSRLFTRLARLFTTAAHIQPAAVTYILPRTPVASGQAAPM